MKAHEIWRTNKNGVETSVNTLRLKFLFDLDLRRRILRRICNGFYILGFIFLLQKMVGRIKNKTKNVQRGLLCLTIILFSLFLQELNSNLERAAQEKNDLLDNVSALEERILSAENESKVLQERLNSLTEDKTGIENEMASLKESLQTTEKEKQV